MLLASFIVRFSSEGLAFSALAFFTMLFALDVRRTQIYVAWGALAGLLGASWIASWMYRLGGVRAQALVPRRVALGTPTVLALTLANDSEGDFASLRVRGPFLPWDGEWIERAGGLARLEKQSRARLEAKAAFYRRGEHHLDPFVVQALVPFGLALGPPLLTEAPRFLVVPRVAVVASLELPRTRRNHPGGVPRASHTADSRELMGVRPYRPGDAMRELHVKTWARTGQPFVREYQEEFFAHVAILVDAAARVPKKERAAARWRRRVDGDDDALLEGALSLAAGIVGKVVGGEALVDLGVLGDTDEPIALGRGRGTLDAALDRLATVARGDALDVEEAVAALVARRERLSSIVVVLSGWDVARAALVRRLREEGLAVLVVRVVDEAAEEGVVDRVRCVWHKRVLDGEAIAL